MSELPPVLQTLGADGCQLLRAGHPVGALCWGPCGSWPATAWPSSIMHPWRESGAGLTLFLIQTRIFGWGEPSPYFSRSANQSETLHLDLLLFWFFKSVLIIFSCNIFWSVFALIDVVNQWGMYRWDAMTWSQYVVCLGGLLTYWVSSPCLLVWWLLSLEAKCLTYKISLKCESIDRETNDLE